LYNNPKKKEDRDQHQPFSLKAAKSKEKMKRKAFSSDFLLVLVEEKLVERRRSSRNE